MDRGGLPLPEQVRQLKEKVEELPTEARIIKMDWSESRWTVLGALGLILGAAFIGFMMYTYHGKRVEEIRAGVQRAESQNRLRNEREVRNLSIAVQQVDIDAEQRGRDEEVCARACSVTNLQMIRQSPCMCGGEGQLILFSADYSTLSRIREVERFQLPEPEVLQEDPEP